MPKPQQMLHVLRTLQSLHPDWVFCRESAAVAFGLPVSYERFDAIHIVTSQSNRNPSSEGVRWHVVDDDVPVVVQGLRVTSFERTVFDCMRHADFKQALAIADSALRISGCSSGSFVSYFRRVGGSRTGATRAIRTMYYADGLSESGGESIARATMIEQGFSIPQLQVSFPQPLDKRRTFRVDFLWTRLDGTQVIGEFDGMRKYEDDALRSGRTSLRVLADEQHREAQLTLYSMPIVRFSYKDVASRNRFAELLKSYGIPQSDEVARAERRLERSRSASAQIFTVISLAD